MSKINSKLKSLSPEQKAKLEKKIREKVLLKNQAEKINRRTDLTKFPMSFEQKRLWFLDKLNPNSTFYNIPAIIKINGKLNKYFLEKSIEKVFERHQVLNSSFNIIGNDTTLTINKISTPLIQEIFTQNINHTLKEVIHTVFDLSKHPLYKINLINISSNESILVFVFHHIIIDGWSINILIHEIINNYQSIQKNENINIDELEIQYFDYAEWQINSFQEGKFNSQLEYWIKKLENLPSAINLPIDKKRPTLQTFNGSRFSFDIPIQLVNKLKLKANNLGLSPFMVFLSAFQILLMKFTGEEDFTIGIPSVNRKRLEVQELIGFFVNSLVIRTNFGLDSLLEEALTITKQNVLEAFENQEIPFDKVAESVQKDRLLSHSPLFQVMFDFQENPLKNIIINDLSFELIDYELPIAKFDLLLTIQESKENVRAIIEYNKDLFFEESIKNLVDVYLEILLSLSSEKNVKISDLNIIPISQKNKILYEWNNTITDYPSTKNVVDLFIQTVEKYPNNIAIEFNDIQISYSELNNKSTQLANSLIELGAVQGDKIAIYLNQSIEMIISMIAILKTGSVYVPIDISYPIDRIKHMILDTNSSVIVTDTNLEFTLTGITNKKLLIDEFDYSTNSNIQNYYIPEIKPSDSAYIIYTSGSTGKPKGVVIPHKGIVRLVKNTNYVEICENDNIAQISNSSFDAATFEIWGSLLNGAKLCIIKKELILSNLEFYNIIREKNISLLFITTSLFNQYAKFNSNTFSCLRSLFFGGEVSDPEAVKLVFENCPTLNLYNVYGPTENTTFTTFHKLSGEDFLKRSLPIGKPISNTTTYITDKKFNLLPIGFPGELLIGGDGLAIEYFKTEELTTKKFINLSYIQEYKKVYRSGDIARYLNDGSIEFIGRVDDQVKLRGFRIELGEIESALKLIPEILDAVVILYGATAIDKKLVAYFVSAEQINISTIKSILGKELPEYMIPTVFIKIEKIPINPNGKVDKKLLPKPEDNLLNSERKYIAPRNSLEKYLVSVWEEVLSIKNIGVYDNFFEIGGNSLKAAILMNRIQQDFNVSTHVSSIFKVPTIAEFCNYVAEYYPKIILEHFTDSKELFHSSLEKSEFNESSLDKKKIKLFEDKIVPLTWERRSKKNPKAVFILSPPRTGSTLLRIMLAGNDSLFSPPELDLLSFNYLVERRDFFIANKLDIWLESTIRAIMELKSCDVNAAKKIMDYYEQSNYSCIDFYNELQNWAGNRILVDKTPSYSLDLEILKRIQEDFEEPHFIHLLRNPYAMIYSFIEAKLDKQFFKYDNPFTRRELAELIWLVSNKNILKFKALIPNSQFHTLKFEDLISEPKRELEKICRFLNIEFNDEMLKPYSGNKMTDGILPGKQMVGDFKFYLRNKIDNNVIDKWKNIHKDDFISDETISLANRLGYELTDGKQFKSPKTDTYSKITRVHRNKKLQLSPSQQRLWFLENFEGPNHNYNIISTIKIEGEFDLEIFNQIINNIIVNQEILKTTYLTIDGKPIINLEETYKYKTEVIDISHKTEVEKESFVKKFFSEESVKLFDISNLPLFRIKVIKLDDRKFVLTISMHHIISDGWSMQIFINEIANAYENLIKNKPINLHKPTIQYVDYAAWYLEKLSSKLFKDKLDYWKNKFENYPPISTFPIVLPRPKEQSHRGKRIYFDLNTTFFNSIKSISNQESVTSFNVLLAIYAVLLARYSNQKDIIIGVPVAQRDNKELESIIGFFVNTIALRIKLSNSLTFIELLKESKNNLLDAFENKDVPFEKIIELINSERDMSYSPIFQTMFAYNTTTLENVSLSTLKLYPINLDTLTSKFDLTFEVTERNADYKIAVEFNTDIYTESYINNIIENFKNLLREFLLKPNLNIFETKLVSSREIALIDSALKTNNFKIEHSKNFVNQFEERVLLNRNSIAVEDLEKYITYNDLNIKANKIANYLLQLNIKSEDRVAILLEKSALAIEVILGILKVGAAYIPIDPNYPQERIDYIISDSNPKLLITSSSIEYFTKKTEIINIEKELPKLERVNSENPNVKIESENLAYIIYTSGSTGKPKGVAVQHKSIMNLYFSLRTFIYKDHLNKQLKVSLNAPLQFDASVQQLVQLMNGYTLVLIPQEIKNDMHDFNEYIIKKRINVLDCVPSQLKLLIDADLFDRQSELEICLPGGEAIDIELWNKCRKIANVNFYNMYGPTECTVDTIISNIKEYEIPNLGKPILNTDIFILDQNLNKVPYNVVGEIFISETSLARGYFNKPEKTAAVFLPNPYGVNGSRIYKTGDLAKLDFSNNLIYLGRNDFQVKLRGFRIELEEIENTLKKYHKIKNAIVVLDSTKSKMLIGYVILKNNQTSDFNEIKDYLLNYLPEYMIPSAFIFIDQFPLSPNGKIDRNKLPKYELDKNNSKTEFIAPSNDKEILLAEIWKKILKIESIGVRDNFFELGGDSISSIQLVAEARKKGIFIKPKTVFQYPTIEGLVQHAEINQEIKSEQGILTGKFSLSPIQLWFFEQNFENPNHWNQSILIELNEELDKILLAKTVQLLIEQHDILRAKFYSENGIWKQEYQSNNLVNNFFVEELSNQDIRNVEEICNRYQQKLNIFNADLIKFVYIKNQSLPNYLFIVSHHLVIDGISWRILLADFEDIYFNLLNKNNYLSPTKTTSYRQWNNILIEKTINGNIKNELTFWNKQIELMEELNSTIMKEYYEKESNILTYTFDESLTVNILTNVNNIYNTEPQEIILIAFIIALKKNLYKDKIALTLESHGREVDDEHIDITKTIGWFTAIYPLVFNINGLTELHDQIITIKDTLRSVPSFGINFGVLKYLLKPINGNSKLVDFDLPGISFNYLGRFSTDSKNLNYKISSISKGHERSLENHRSFYLDFSASVNNDNLVVHWTYCNNVLEEKLVKKLNEDFSINLSKIVEHCLTAREVKLSASDFSDVKIDNDELDDIISELNN